MQVQGRRLMKQVLAATKVESKLNLTGSFILSVSWNPAKWQQNISERKRGA